VFEHDDATRKCVCERVITKLQIGDADYAAAEFNPFVAITSLVRYLARGSRIAIESGEE